MEQAILAWTKNFDTGWPDAVEASLILLLVRVFLAALYLIAGLWLAARASGLLRRNLDRVRNLDKTLIAPLAHLLSVSILVLTGFTILTTFGVQTTAILAVLSGAALAIGLAVQGTLSNVAAGIMLLVLRPLQNGQYVNASGAEGNVIEINLFRTRIRTLAGAVISVPNSNVFGSNIINYSSGEFRGLWEAVGIAYDADIDKAREIILTLLAADPAWYQDPEPKVYVTALGDFAITLTVSARCATSNYFSARAQFLERVKNQFDANGVGIPFPTRTVHVAPSEAVTPTAAAFGQLLEKTSD